MMNVRSQPKVIQKTKVQSVKGQRKQDHIKTASSPPPPTRAPAASPAPSVWVIIKAQLGCYHWANMAEARKLVQVWQPGTPEPNNTRMCVRSSSEDSALVNVRGCVCLRALAAWCGAMIGESPEMFPVQMFSYNSNRGIIHKWAPGCSVDQAQTNTEESASRVLLIPTCNALQSRFYIFETAMFVCFVGANPNGICSQADLPSSYFLLDIIVVQSRVQERALWMQERILRGGRRCWQAGVGWIQQKTYKRQTSVRTKKHFCILGKSLKWWRRLKNLQTFGF